MLKIVNESFHPPKYVAVCAFNPKNRFLIYATRIQTEPTLDGLVFVQAWANKQLIFCHVCRSVQLLDERLVKRLPVLKGIK